MDKRYKVRVSFGDGNPIEDTVIARSGMLAQDLAMKLHPGARNIHLIGIDNRYEPQKPVAVEPELRYGSNLDLSTKESMIQCCIQMRNEGKSQRAIAGYLGLAKSTVARWIKQYG